MHVFRLRVKVTSDHQLSLTLPPDFPLGDVEITVRSANDAESAESTLAQQRPNDLRAFFEFLKTVPTTGRTREEIDKQIREERDAWE